MATLTELLAAEFDQETAVTRRLLERIPAELFDWKPHAKSMSLRELASHIAGAPAWVRRILETQAFEATQGGPEPPAGSLDELLSRFDRNVAEGKDSLAKAPEALWEQPWSFLVNGQPRLTLPKYGAFRGFVINHLVHHRGQLSVYLRLKDVPIPSIYGPSADDPGV